MLSSLCLSDDAPLSPSDISLEEIIFSCDICQATVSEVYATKEHHEGFHSGSPSNDGNGIVTKFWIGACSHVFCGKHLDGGGVAFHPEGIAPNAGCPVCPKNLPSSRKQDLFAIRGLHAGEYDEIIPQSWLRCPPTRLDAQDVEMDALRFQYQRLASYSRKVNKAWKIADRKRRVIESNLSNERKQWRKREAESKEALQERDVLIQEQDAKLKKWDARKDVINHYMSIIGPMAKDIASMRALLQDLGYEVPERDYSYQPKNKTKPAVHEEQKRQGHRHDSSATLVGSNVRSSSASRKRKANNDAYADSQEQGHVQHQSQVDNERTLMRPPPLPKFRPARQTDVCAGHSVSQVQSMQPNHSGGKNTLSCGGRFVEDRSQQARDSQHQAAERTQRTGPQSHEKLLISSQKRAIGSRQRISYAREQQISPPLPTVQMYGSTGWQDRPLPRDTPGVRHDYSALGRSEQKFVQAALPDRSLRANPEIERSTEYDQPPSRVPLTRVIPYQQEQIAPASRASFNKSGGWHGGTPKGSMGVNFEPQSSRMQPAQPHQFDRHLVGPSSQKPRRPHVGHNGTSTLSSEFRAQERPTNLNRHQTCFPQPVTLRSPQRASLPIVRNNAHLEPRPHATPEVSYYHPVYSTLERQSGGYAPREVEGSYMPPSPGVQGVQAPPNDGGRYRLSTPAIRKHLEPPIASSVVSPFFGQSSRRQTAISRQGDREEFSYVPAPRPARGNVMNRYERNAGMPPPPMIYPRLDRSMQSRDDPFAQHGNAPVGNSNEPAEINTRNCASQRVPLATNSRPSQPEASRERVSLPPALHSTQRYLGRGAGVMGTSAVDTRSIFSGSGPTRRSIRR